MTTLSTPKIDQTVNDLALLLKSAGDPLRLQVLRALRTDSYGVLELSHIFDVAQSGMSHHLKVLARAGLVTTRKEGNSAFYRRHNPATGGSRLHQVKLAIFAAADELMLPDVAQKRLGDIHQQRAEASRNYFRENAQAFREQQDLIAEFGVYSEHVAQALQHCVHRGKALEIGPGIGEFLPQLAAQFEQVVALDNAQEMLDKAQALSAAQQLNNIDFVFNDTAYCQENLDTFDCVVTNMVLHHTPSPAQIFSDVVRCLRPDGVFIVCDLCPHDQDWARSACGDLWLGFDPLELDRWARSAGLHTSQSAYFAQRNGFQIQLQLYTK